MGKGWFLSRILMPSKAHCSYGGTIKQALAISVTPTEDDGGLEKRLQRLFELQESLDRASAISCVHVLDVIARGCVRFQAHATSTQAKVFRLIESGAFVDAIFTLQETELPQWKLRRIIYDDVRWHCAFSRYFAVPMELDHIAEGSHEVLPLAILNAFLGAQRLTLIAKLASTKIRSAGAVPWTGRVLRQLCLTLANARSSR